MTLIFVGSFLNYTAFKLHAFIICYQSYFLIPIDIHLE